MTAPQTFYVVGGERRPATGREEWETGVAGLLYKVTVPVDGAPTIEEIWRYTAEEAFPFTQTMTPVVFKSSTRHGNRVLLSTVTEVLEFDLESRTVIRRVSHPWFNDVHHVSSSRDDTFLVVITGLDMAVRIDWNGNVIEQWSALPDQSPWERFSQDTDYRQVPTTKPHQSHPNFVCETKDGLWLTRFDQRDAINLLDKDKRLPIPPGNPHDGEIGPDARHWFTTTNGHLVAVDRQSPDTPDIYDLNDIIAAGRPLGWCRGLHFPETGKAVVGFSRLRRTKIKENVRWVKDQLKQGLGIGEAEDLTPLPTRIACIDLQQGEQLWSVDFSNTPLSEIFSIL